MDATNPSTSFYEQSSPLTFGAGLIYTSNDCTHSMMKVTERDICQPKLKDYYLTCLDADLIVSKTKEVFPTIPPRDLNHFLQAHERFLSASKSNKKKDFFNASRDYVNATADLQLKMLDVMGKSLWEEIKNRDREKNIEIIAELSIAIESLKTIFKNIMNFVEKIHKLSKSVDRASLITRFIEKESVKMAPIFESASYVLLDIYKFGTEGFTEEDISGFKDRVNDMVNVINENITVSLEIDGNEIITQLPSELITV